MKENGESSIVILWCAQLLQVIVILWCAQLLQVIVILWWAQLLQVIVILWCAQLLQVLMFKRYTIKVNTLESAFPYFKPVKIDIVCMSNCRGYFAASIV